MEVKKLTNHFFSLKGSAYAIGRQQAASIKQIPPLVQWFTGNSAAWKEQVSAKAWLLYRTYCPGLMEELQGWADELQVDPAALMYGYHTILIPHCSHVVIPPSLNSEGHMLVARSYEFDIDTHDFSLIYTASEGHYAHLGNSVLFLGRLDGINERQLSVTMSAGGIPRNMVNPSAPPVQEGLQFWAVIRSILENCATVDEGISWLKQIPIGGNPILMLADQEGNAAKVECFGPKVAVTRLGEGQNSGFLYAINHFTHPEMQSVQDTPMANSLVREGTIRNYVEVNQGHIDLESLKTFLGQAYPDGLCCHYYADYFGTLYQMVLDLTSREMNICFGSPLANPWHRFTFEQAEKMFPCDYPIELPQERPPQDFWK
jgi:predicted choloylglycine hydrolase